MRHVDLVTLTFDFLTIKVLCARHLVGEYCHKFEDRSFVSYGTCT